MPADRIWIKNPLALFTANDQEAPGGLVVENGVIVEMLAAGASPALPVNETFDAREHVVLPGLVNTHHHFYQTLTRAWGPVVNEPLFNWLLTLYPVWARLTPQALQLASKVARPSCCCPAAPRRRITTTCFRAGSRTPSTSRSGPSANWACVPCSPAVR